MMHMMFIRYVFILCEQSNQMGDDEGIRQEVTREKFKTNAWLKQHGLQPVQISFFYCQQKK